ncbi:MAG: UDP-N-acetylmuramate dehydrogenase [Bradymonadia bacterium]|jgi:UDP-N-acetylmuramate dehydrogenase
MPLSQPSDLSDLPGVAHRVDLADRTTLGVGGPARWLLQAATLDAAIAAVDRADAAGVPVLILGGGSNLLIDDAGFDGLVVRLPDAEPVRAGPRWTLTAGNDWNRFVGAAVAANHAGVECLAGIPGTIGAAPIQNIGAYGQEVAEVVDAVEVWDRVARVRRWIARDDCGFGYRTSRFKATDAGRFMVLSVRMTLRPGGPATVRYRDLVNRLGDAPTLAETRAMVIAVRRTKSMVLDASHSTPPDPNRRSAGSFFVNPIVSASAYEDVAARFEGEVPHWPASTGSTDGRIKLAAAWLIEQSGMPKGYDADAQFGPVGLSTKHTLALVNRGGATAAQVRAFAAHVQDRVEAAFGVRLVPEPQFVEG